MKEDKAQAFEALDDLMNKTSRKSPRAFAEFKVRKGIAAEKLISRVNPGLEAALFEPVLSLDGVSDGELEHNR